MDQGSPASDDEDGRCVDNGKMNNPEAGVPWLTMDVQKKMKYRDGDIICSVPAKSGTTWTMNIVHQLRSNGDQSFEDIYVEVPWVEVVDRPGRTVEELVETVNSMPTERRRAFKTHSAPPVMPYFDPATKDVRYIVVARNPEESVASMKPFLDGHNDEFFEMWGLPVHMFKFPDFRTFYDEFIIGRNFYSMFFRFVESWWPLRNNENVMFLHYTQLKENHEESLKKIANFLGIEPDPDAWQTIIECTSFKWMKQHEERFEMATISPVPPLKRGNMIRKGKAHKSREDGFTEDMSKDLAKRGRKMLKDEDAFAWLYHGVLPEDSEKIRQDKEKERRTYRHLESWREWL